MSSGKIKEEMGNSHTIQQHSIRKIHSLILGMKDGNRIRENKYLSAIIKVIEIFSLHFESIIILDHT